MDDLTNLALASPFGHYLFNSAIVVLGCIIGNLVSCSMAAYAFARLEFTGKRMWFAIMLGTIMLPIHVIIVPQYVLFSQLDWVNTFLPLIVPKLPSRVDVSTDRPQKGHEEAARIGTELGNNVHDALPSLTPIDRPRLAVATRAVTA